MEKTKIQKIGEYLFNINNHTIHFFMIPLFVYVIVMIRIWITYFMETASGDLFKIQVLGFIIFIYLTVWAASINYSQGFYKISVIFASTYIITGNTWNLQISAIYTLIMLIIRYIWIFKQAKEMAEKRFKELYR